MTCSSKRLSGPTIWAVIAALSLACITAAVSCTPLSNPKPTAEEIRKAIIARGAWNPIVGRIELQTVEIEQIGIFNSEKKYWPVKAKVKTAKTGQTAILNFQIFRDDYGQWAARLAERS